MNVSCLWCGKRVPREGPVVRALYPTVTASPNPNAGRPSVSVSMLTIDPDGLFCTMRCAARYAVEHVKKNSSP